MGLSNVGICVGPVWGAVPAEEEEDQEEEEEEEEKEEEEKEEEEEEEQKRKEKFTPAKRLRAREGSLTSKLARVSHRSMCRDLKVVLGQPIITSYVCVNQACFPSAFTKSWMLGSMWSVLSN
eukprot:1155798-Pelagomonas_calceolata.AAC.3